MKCFFRSDTIILILILGVAAFLRFYQLDSSSLWHDEGNTWALVQRAFAEIARDAAADIHPPGYYWLLKVWTSIFGISAYAIRSLSALTGLLLVSVVYAIGKSISAEPSDGTANQLPYFALLAAWIVALNPFQIYYSQEARMYSLLALESAALFWALLMLQRSQRISAQQGAGHGWFNGPSVAYVLIGAAGLWTHYSFPIVLAAAGLAYLIVWVLESRKSQWQWIWLLQFVVLNTLILLAFLPWLRTAIDSLLNWPKGGVAVPFADGLVLTLGTLLFGPLRHVPEPLWPWLTAAALLPLIGIFALRSRRGVVALALWLLAPIGLMFGLGLFSDAFLKFLLVASPAWCLLAAGMPQITDVKDGSIRVVLQVVLALAAVFLAALTLPAYYADANARENYAGVARYVEVVADPATDLVLLNAPGQEEVWSYYDPGVPTLALPSERPADPDATVAELADATSSAGQIFALFWATDEADPSSIVETWLDRNAYKGVESWQGNMRFVTYTMANNLVCRPLDDSLRFAGPAGPLFALEEFCAPDEQQSVAPGEPLLVGLRWRSLTETADSYKVSLQLLNEREQVIAQQDSEPGGGSSPTSTWQAGDLVEDNHGLWIPFGTPPGVYRLSLAFYETSTGERLSTDGGESAALGQIQVNSMEKAIPTDIVPMQHRLNKPIGPISLVGYDMHRRGYAHAPETPVTPGDTVELVLYWQAPDPLPADWPSDLLVEVRLGDQFSRLPLANAGYPTAMWSEGELVRAVVDITYDGGDRRPTLSVDGETVRLDALPQ
jgi:mannosyltransferase